MMSHSMSTIIIQSKNFNFRDYIYFKFSDKVYLYNYFLVILIDSAKAFHNMQWKFYFVPITNVWSRIVVHFNSEFFHMMFTFD